MPVIELSFLVMVGLMHVEFIIYRLYLLSLSYCTVSVLHALVGVWYLSSFKKSELQTHNTILQLVHSTKVKSM